MTQETKAPIAFGRGTVKPTVVTMCTGGAYWPQEVQCLKRQVERNLEMPHDFICIADQPIPGVTTVDPPTNYPGWWGKLGLFANGFATGPTLWLDLDVCIVGRLDGLVLKYCQHALSAPNNWAKSGHGGVQSSVMAWRGNTMHQILYSFNPEHAYWPPRNDRYWGRQVAWGDQEWISHLRDQKLIKVHAIEKGLIVSYKYHCQTGAPPAGAKIVVFHGKPKPGDVNDKWVKECRR